MKQTPQNHSLVTYFSYFTKNGLRLISQLTSAPIRTTSQLGLPMDSIYHYIDYVGATTGPDSQDPLFSTYKKAIFVKHISDYHLNLEQKGVPRVVPGTLDSTIRVYHSQNRRMRLMRDPALIMADSSTLMVYSYSLLPNKYRYIKNAFSSYNSWYNEFATALLTAKGLSETSNRQQFFMLDVPPTLPPVSKLNNALNDLNTEALKTFNTPALFTMLHLWMYYSEKNRNQSVFSIIDDSKSHLFNLILKDGSHWCVINLGVINSFLEYDKSELLKYKSNVKLTPGRLQMRLLRLYMSVLDGAIKDVKDVLDGDTDASDDAENVPVNTTGSIVDITALDGDKSQVEEALIVEDLQLTDDLGQLEKTQADVGTIGSKTIVLKGYESTPPEYAVLKNLDRLSETGAITSVKQYNAFKEMSTAYKRIKLADGRTLEQAMVVDPKDTLLDNTLKFIPDDKTIVDKSMKDSVIAQYDSQYVSKVMDAHVLKSIIAIQGGGVCVTDVNIDEYGSILGSSKNYAISLTPLQGKSSTLHFKLPVVAKDGTYVANGNKYRLIKQIGDVPIRKIAPDKVSLTTYYSKLFVCRGSKVSTDYGIWVGNSVMSNALNEENKIITAYIAGNYPVDDCPMPRAYTALMGRFKTITVRGFDIYLDQNLLKEKIPSEIIEIYAGDGKYVVGVNKAKSYLILDEYASVYIVDKQSVKEAGTFEDFLDINIATAPVEYIDVDIFGKNISVGFILAYYYGFENLLNALKAKYRTVLSGQRINMLPDEYTVVFKDQTYVLERDEKVNSLIIAGFRLYHKAIKMYDSHNFNSKSVYGSILAAYGLNIRYLRELDLMEDLYVDPISKEVLIKMKEPTDFKSLLLRSAELLSTDKATRELQLAGQMRIKGYERFSGVVYQELVRALRAHNAAPAKSVKTISMNPHAVWGAISEDGAKQLISDINPIEDLRGSEALTLSGSGGRNKRTMVKRTRAYDVTHMGVISEATKDSSDVGINTYLSANPGIKDIYGFTINAPDLKAPATMLSTSALMAPGSDVDD
jgi:hypothetical protein